MKRKFLTNEFYHIFNQGVDKRKVYLDKNDYLRFIHDLYEFNDSNPAPEYSRYHSRIKSKEKGENTGNLASHTAKRDSLVNLYAFALMPNHHHLLVEQVRENGISMFMNKLHGGYSRAFNQKHNRNGHLFQGPFKSIYIKGDVHLGFLICYVHANPLDLWKPKWKEKQLNDQEINQALKFLEKYKQSSYLDYMGKNKSQSPINKQFLLEFFDGTKGYREFFIDWLKEYKKNIEHIKGFIIE